MVGGAAGSVSKIFSGVGKGLAALTFDSDFQKQRRKQLKKRADQNFGEGMARNTRGLAMGIFEGVTGVATKPIQGAKQEGVGGFFKGNFFCTGNLLHIFFLTSDFIEEFSCSVNKLSVILTALYYKPALKNRVKNIQAAAYIGAHTVFNLIFLFFRCW